MQNLTPTTTDQSSARAFFAKLLSVILRKRLDAFATSQRLRAEGQAGFVSGRRTSDHIFPLRHLIDRSRLLQGGPGRLFSCFVDFQKAYDCVRRDLLYKLLASVGVSGHMLRTLCSMYWGVSVIPKVGSALGEAIDSTCGVRQGDPLSPLLFGLFIDRFEAFVTERAPGVGVALGGQLLHMLLYADDMVLVFHDPAGLQKLLDVLGAFCDDNCMIVNVPKTEIVVFGPSKWKPPPGHSWRYGDQPIPVSDHFKYLGVELHSTKGLGPAVER